MLWAGKFQIAPELQKIFEARFVDESEADSNSFGVMALPLLAVNSATKSFKFDTFSETIKISS